MDELGDVYRLERAAFTAEAFAPEEVAVMRRHVRLADEFRRSRYFTEQERSLHVTMDEASSQQMTLPDAGATRDMVVLLRELYSDRERASFASVAALLRAHADPESSSSGAHTCPPGVVCKLGRLWSRAEDGGRNRPTCSTSEHESAVSQPWTAMGRKEILIPAESV